MGHVKRQMNASNPKPGKKKNADRSETIAMFRLKRKEDLRFQYSFSFKSHLDVNISLEDLRVGDDYPF